MPMRVGAAETSAQPPTTTQRIHPGPVFPSHWEGLGKSLPFWSLSSLVSIIKDALNADRKVHT